MTPLDTPRMSKRLIDLLLSLLRQLDPEIGDKFYG